MDNLQWLVLFLIIIVTLACLADVIACAMMKRRHKKQMQAIHPYRRIK